MKVVKLETLNDILNKLKKKRDEISAKTEQTSLDLDFNIIDIRKYNFCISILEKLSERSIEVDIDEELINMTNEELLKLMRNETIVVGDKTFKVGDVIEKRTTQAKTSY